MKVRNRTNRHNKGAGNIKAPFRDIYPVTTVLALIRKFIDRRALIKKDLSISYSLYNYNTREAIRKELNLEQIKIIFNDVYPNILEV